MSKKINCIICYSFVVLSLSIILMFLLVFYFQINAGNETVKCNPVIYQHVSRDILKARLKMGPHKSYRLLPNGALQVEVDGKWLRLKYKN